MTILSSSSTDTYTSHFVLLSYTVRRLSLRTGSKEAFFFREWTSFVEHMTTDHTDSIIVGDVNFHLDSDSNTDARRFKDSSKQ